MKLLYILLTLALFVAGWCFGRGYEARTQRPRQTITVEDMVKRLQHRVGAEEDGIIGTKDTMPKVNTAVKAERRAKADKYALRYIEAPVRPDKELEKK